MQIIGVLLGVVLILALAWALCAGIVAIAAAIAGWSITTGEAFGAGLLLLAAGSGGNAR